MSKYLRIIFIILTFAISSFANEWKPDEWLISKSIKISLTPAEKESVGISSEEEMEIYENYYKKVIAGLPKKIEAKDQTEIITSYVIPLD